MVSQASRSLCLLGLLSSPISAFALNNLPAEATAATDILPNLAFPTPTPAPDNHELRRRQEAQRTLLVGPDATCGFIGGNATQPWGCTASSTCAFATSIIQVLDSTTTTAPGSVLCCDSASGCPTRPGPTSCVDKGRFDIKTACTGSCLEDEQVLKCTSGIYIFCNTITFPTPSISAFFCNYLSNYVPVSALTTISGQGGRRAFTPTIQALPSPSSTSSSLTSTTAPSSIIGTSSVVRASASPAANGDGGKESKNNKGAIIGGVVGGIAGLVLIAALLFLALRWRKARKVEPIAGDEGGKGTSPVGGSSEAVGTEKVEGKAEDKKVVA